jgi:NADH:ubiquinone oxidoreductase subunit 6 (subunit J)
MKLILLFLILQSLYVLFGMSDANQLSIVVLSTAIVIFVSSYVAVLIKERKHKQNLVNALINSN